MDNFLYIPFINPVIFYDTDRVNLPKYFTNHFEIYPFSERFYEWETRLDHKQLWQTEDIINLQFESTFDPIVVRLMNKSGMVLNFTALRRLPNIYIPNTWSYEVSISLAGLVTGWYYLEIEAGTGVDKKILQSGCQYISSVPIANTLCIEYWHSSFNKDVIFETGIKFQHRLLGSFGKMEIANSDERYRDEAYNPALLSSKSSKIWPVYFSDQYGIPDDVFFLVNEIFGCDNVLIDGKPFAAADGSKLDSIDVDRYKKRGAVLKVEEGINRKSRVFALETDTTKKLVTSILVEGAVFGDLANQGSANTVPVHGIFFE